MCSLAQTLPNALGSWMNVTENRRGITKVKKKTASPIFWRQRSWFFTPLKDPQAHPLAFCGRPQPGPLHSFPWIPLHPPSPLKIGPLAPFYQWNDLCWNGGKTNQAQSSLPSPSPTSKGSNGLSRLSMDYNLIKGDHLFSSSFKLFFFQTHFEGKM